MSVTLFSSMTNILGNQFLMKTGICCFGKNITLKVFLFFHSKHPHLREKILISYGVLRYFQVFLLSGVTDMQADTPRLPLANPLKASILLLYSFHSPV